MIKKSLYTILCLTVMSVFSSDIADSEKKGLALQTSQTATRSIQKLRERKVSFVNLDESQTNRMPFTFSNDISIEDKKDVFIEIQRQTHIQRYTQDLKDDIAECCYCGQLARFSLLGCCIFIMGWSYGADSAKSSCGNSNFRPFDKMK